MNKGLIDALRELAKLTAEDQFRSVAFLRAAATLSKLDYKITVDTAPNTTDRKLPGIGAAISQYIGEYLATGQITALEKLRNDPIVKARDILGKVAGAGPVTVAAWIGQKIYNLDDLARAVAKRRVVLTPAQSVGLKYYADLNRRIPRRTMAKTFSELRSYLPARCEVAGSYRRGELTSGDIDIVCLGQYDKALLDDPRVCAVLSHGPTRLTFIWCSERCLQVDILVTTAISYYAALQYFTGSAEHNEYLRWVAKKKGWRLNEKGLFIDGHAVRLRDERDIYVRLGVDYLPPSAR
jgi:DNA polymerase/3'-5' exonuclease PolX